MRAAAWRTVRGWDVGGCTSLASGLGGQQHCCRHPYLVHKQRELRVFDRATQHLFDAHVASSWKARAERDSAQVSGLHMAKCVTPIPARGGGQDM